MSNSDFFTQIKKEHIHENINHMWKLAYLLFNIFIKKNTTFHANKHRRKEVFALKTNFKITLYYSQKVIKTFNKFSILSLKKVNSSCLFVMTQVVHFYFTPFPFCSLTFTSPYNCLLYLLSHYPLPFSSLSLRVCTHTHKTAFSSIDKV